MLPYKCLFTRADDLEKRRRKTGQGESPSAKRGSDGLFTKPSGLKLELASPMPIVGYILFSAALFYLFFLGQFPYERVKKNIVQSFEDAFPFRLSIGRVGPYFPVNLLIEDIRIASAAANFQLPDMDIHPNLPGFIFGKTGFSLKDAKSLQRPHGEFQQEKTQGKMKIRLNHLVVKAFSPKGYSFPLKLSGEATLKWTGEETEKGNGQAWVWLEKGEITGAQDSELLFPWSLFDTLRAEIQMQEGDLRLKRLEVVGKDLKGTFQGDFSLSGIEKGGFPDLKFI